MGGHGDASGRAKIALPDFREGLPVQLLQLGPSHDLPRRRGCFGIAGIEHQLADERSMAAVPREKSRRSGLGGQVAGRGYARGKAAIEGSERGCRTAETRAGGERWKNAAAGRRDNGALIVLAVMLASHDRGAVEHAYLNRRGVVGNRRCGINRAPNPPRQGVY